MKAVRLMLVLVMMSAAFAIESSATTQYVSQSGGTYSGGSACNGHTAISIATFNAGSESAGNTYYFCGVITTPPSIKGSGTSGNVITFLWDTGARISVPYGQIINLNGNSYLLFDGGPACGPKTSCYTTEYANQTGYPSGIAGIIEATANGSALANQNTTTQAFYGAANSHDIEIRHLIIRNLYIHSSLSDSTNSADSGNFAFQCPYGPPGCAAGIISIHDNDIHDTGNSISFERGITTTLNLYNNEMYHNNWALENSGNGTRTINLYGNEFHDGTNWDTTADTYHHNAVHNYMNVSSDSLGFYMYNNVSDGDWGPCCTTSNFLFTEVAPPANMYVFNNTVIQSCNNNTAPPIFAYTQNAGAGGAFYNNTFLGCATTAGNVWAGDLYGTSIAWENNAVQGYGQYAVVGTGTTFSVIDHNIYGAAGSSGNPAWQCGATGNGSFAAWQSSCSADAHGQNVSSLNVSATAGVPNSGSPLITAGANLTSLCAGPLTALCSDAAGNPRPTSGAWDAGAYQYNTGTVAPPPPPVVLPPVVK
jgi:hypothetical protein